MADEASKKRLGRGLAALIGEMDQPVVAAKAAAQQPSDKTVPIEQLRANAQNPRRHFGEAELLDLTNSIRKHGIVQPILVRPVNGEDLAGANYEIIAGERRWRAAQKAGLHAVPVIIRAVEDRQALELAIIENVQRADLSPVEEARGYQQLIDEYDYSQAELGNVIGKSRSHVANTLRLLKLPEDILALVTEGALSAGHARTLVTAADASALARKIVAEGLSVRQAELLAQKPENESPGAASSPPGKRPILPKSADVLAVEKRLEERLGYKVSLNYKDNGSGDIKIAFRTLEQLDEICRRLETGF